MLKISQTARTLSVLKSFARDQTGATAIEYGLICALIFLAIVSAIYSYTDSANGMYGRISDAVSHVSP